MDQVWTFHIPSYGTAVSRSHDTNTCTCIKLSWPFQLYKLVLGKYTSTWHVTIVTIMWVLKANKKNYMFTLTFLKKLE